MDNFYIYQNKPSGSNEQEVSIVDLIPIGKTNAIKREELMLKCVEVGLIAESIADKDRKMRKLIEKAKLDYSITNDGDGAGYYRPTREGQLLPSEVRKFPRLSKRIIRLVGWMVIPNGLHKA